jgi:hypothetical protein
MISQDDLIAQRDDLMREKQDNLDKINEVRHWLMQTRASAAITRRYSDANQYAKKVAELRNRGQSDQKLATELGEVNRQLKDYVSILHNRRTFADCFEAVARRELPPELHEKIRAQATALYGIWKQGESNERQKLEAERRFWEGYLRTAEQKGHEQPANRQALRMLNRKW